MFPDGAHSLLHQGDLLLGFLVDAVARGRVGGDHDGPRWFDRLTMTGDMFLGELGLEGLPDFLGDEGHEWVEQAEDAFQNVGQGGQRRRFAGITETDLGHLYVPVAVVVPDELVEPLLSVAKLETFQRAVDLSGDAVEAADNPAVLAVLRGYAAPALRDPASPQAG